MKLAMRAKAFSKKVTLFSTAFILAVSSLTAVVPFVLSEEAGAVGTGNTVFVNAYHGTDDAACGHAPGTEACRTIMFAVNKAGAGDTVELDQGEYNENVTLNKEIHLQAQSGKDVLIRGVSTYTINLKKGAAGSSITGFTLENTSNKPVIKFESLGDSAYTVENNIINKTLGGSHGINTGSSNGVLSGLTIKGNTIYVGNNVRGIFTDKPVLGHSEVSNNTFIGATNMLVLGIEGINSIISGNNFANVTSTNPKQEIVKIQNGATATATGNIFGSNAVSVAGDRSGGNYVGTFTSLSKATQEVKTNGVITLESDLFVPEQATLTAAGVTVVGNNKTLASGVTRVNGSLNAVLYIQASGVAVENLAIDGVGSVGDVHGINTYNATNVTLNNVKLVNNKAAGLNVGRDSSVSVTDIYTANNGWYGVGIDKTALGAFATLDVKGTPGHQEGDKADIFAEKRDDVDAGSVKVTYPAKSYVRFWDGAGYKYKLDTSKPTSEILLDETYNPSELKVKAADDQRLVRLDVSLYKANGERITTWSESISYENKNNYEHDFSAKLAAQNLSDGEYYIKATAKDIFDKSGAAKQKTFFVDTVNPKLTISLENTSVIKKGENPVLNASANDVTSGVETLKYKIQAWDVNKSKFVDIVEYGFKDIVNPTTGLVLNEVDGLQDGRYRVSVHAIDKAGILKGKAIEFTIDRTITSSITIENASTVTPTISGVALHSDGSLAAKVDLVVTIDDDTYDVPTDADGVWSLTPTVTGSNEGVEHEVVVALKGADPAAAPAATKTFTTKFISESENSQGGATTTQGAAARGATQPQLPSVTGPAGQPGAAALGASDEAGEEGSLGASNAKTLADAVDANNTDGKALGLAWYWWILIVAALATIVWWIVAAARKRNAEN